MADLETIAAILTNGVVASTKKISPESVVETYLDMLSELVNNRAQLSELRDAALIDPTALEQEEWATRRAMKEEHERG